MVNEGGSDSNIVVTINGKKYAVPPEFSATSLNDFLRVHLQLTGTKVMCREGGCGVCIVHAAVPTGNGKFQERSINSCLCPILSCDGWEITTVEGLGDQKNPHPIQKQLTEHSGSQCGYCTPGMVMTMYSTIRKEGKSLTAIQAESALDGNICRCTGYRPILDAFKEFTNESASPVCDIEDVSKRICSKTGKQCNGVCDDNGSNYFRPLVEVARAAAPPWYRPTSLADLYKLLENSTLKNPYYVCGHTGIGVYDDGPYDGFISLRGIREMFVTDKKDGVITIGSGVSLTDMIDFFKSEAETDPGFAHLEHFARLISKTAHPAVRNAGSWGGNLAMRNRHKEFPSDTFIALVMCGASVFVGPDEKSYTPEEFVNLDLKNKIVTKLTLKPFDKSHVFRTFKIMPRSANSHAYVNAGFRAKILKEGNQLVIVDRPVLAYGNIAEEFIRASNTEEFLIGKNLADNDTFQRALTTLAQEIQPAEDKSEASPAYKRALAVNLFYKVRVCIIYACSCTGFRTYYGERSYLE
ncbi:uncharacterized protein LOC129602526 [Paramacrobiotus metropolitanus]|uniref:uncharacterized protein LOC129602526 n=1 Tax=Paramacrobiotus metropolitanus TaxID=2943436 RepID=UPI002445A5C5|nr:uncharacterized protein LOC129602526 [Paramacrobiotus metropolitanus]